MIEPLRSITSYDMLFFTPNVNVEGAVDVTSAHYKDAGTDVEPGIMGNVYDIVLFRLDEEGEVQDLDRFDGVLIDPKVYVSRLVKEQWFGVVARKTDTSIKVIDDVYQSWVDIE
jgi:hypothetical protein